MNKKGFTLVECLIVVAIMGIIAALPNPWTNALNLLIGRLNTATSAAIQAKIELEDVNNILIRICEVNDNCTGTTLMCMKASKIKSCVPANPCDFVNGSWEHANQPCAEGVLSVLGGA